jgi:heat shock protein HspQ
MDRENARQIIQDAIDNARYNQEEYEEEEKVRTDDGRGFIVDILTSGFDEEGEESVEASEDSPTYVVILEGEDKPFGYYKADEIESEDWDSGIEDPSEELAEAEDNGRDNLKYRLENALAAIRGREHQEGHFTWPESWRKSEKPARLIAMDAWLSMGPSGVSSCINEMRGEVASPERFCADFADRLYMWDYWRGDSWAPGE